jgi:hypothetical protein
MLREIEGDEDVDWLTVAVADRDTDNDGVLDLLIVVELLLDSEPE